MAQKLAVVDSLLKNPMFGRAGPEAGMAELEAQVRKLGRELRALRDAAGRAGGQVMPPRFGESDHAMLSGRPILGYRCLACDRPLESLDERPGPHIPTHQLTSRTPPEGKSRGGLGPLSPEGSTIKPGERKKVPFDPSQRGPQNW
jgi:hypothetical protein